MAGRAVNRAKLNQELKLSNEELKFVFSISSGEGAYTEENLRQIGVDSHLHRWLFLWIKFIHDVRDGYQVGWEDYANDLDVRALIEEIYLQGSVELKAKIATILIPLDREFMRVTQPAKGAMTGSWDEGKEDKYFWLARLPRLMDGGIRELRGFVKYPVPPDEGYERKPGENDPLEQWLVPRTD